MKTSYTIEEWAALGLLEDVPVHRTEQVVHALNYGLQWIERKSLEESNGVTVLLNILITISTLIDVNDSELEKILDDGKTGFDDFYITSTYYGVFEEIDFQQKYCEKIIKQHKNKLQLN